jgi:hypothetical protein
MSKVKAKGHQGRGSTSKLRMDAEDYAHEVADDFFKREGKGGLTGSQKLARSYAFGTYAGTTPNSMKGPNASFRWDDSSQLVRPTRANLSPMLEGIGVPASGKGLSRRRR